MNIVWKLLVNNPIVQTVVGAIAALAALKLWGRNKKAEGREEAKTEQAQTDVEAAAELHRRAVAGNRMRNRSSKPDKRGYRD